MYLSTIFSSLLLSYLFSFFYQGFLGSAKENRYFFQEKCLTSSRSNHNLTIKKAGFKPALVFLLTRKHYNSFKIRFRVALYSSSVITPLPYNPFNSPRRFSVLLIFFLFIFSDDFTGISTGICTGAT